MKYIGFLKKQTEYLNSTQEDVEKRFVLLGESWSDGVYLKTQEALCEVATTKKVLYEALCRAALSATDYYNAYIEIQGLGSEHLIRKHPFPSYKNTLRRDGSYMQNKFSSTNVTDLVAMESFMRALDLYIKSTADIMTKLGREHSQIVASRSWVAPQCQQLGEVIKSIDTKMKAQLERLYVLNKYIKSKYNGILEQQQKKIQY